jgi:hypothetical protein
MQFRQSLRAPRGVRSVHIRASALAVLAALGSACSSGNEPPQEVKPADVALDGLWRAWPKEGMSFEVDVGGSRARIVRLGPGFEIGNPEVLNGGDPLLTDLTRIDAWTFSGRVATFELGPSPTSPRDWPTSVSYVVTTIKWDDNASRWLVGGGAVELAKQSRTFDGEYAPAGACEQKFTNNNGATLYTCAYPQDEDDCSSSGEKAFWPSTDCQHVGYAFHSNDLFRSWYASETSNVTPGAHGQWGDGSGGGKLVSSAATATGGNPDPNPDPMGGGGKVIASCSDTWVCTEIVSGDAAAFQAQCEKGGDNPSPDPCPDTYKGGPQCLRATFTSVGQLVQGSFYWRSDFCMENPNIDTAGTCMDLGGTEMGKQCPPP